MTATDEALVVVEGVDFEQRLQLFMPDLLSYFLRRARPDDAADCLSETLVVLWRRKDWLPAETDAARAWAFGVARNVLANQRRGGLRQSRLSDALRSELQTFAPPSTEVAASVNAALAMLSERDREVLLLVAWDGFGVAEAGAVIGIKPAAARARYSRARARMRALLDQGATP